ncbi:MAG: M50 family metallopeptidase [Candidatus Thiodiazotropha sp.]
MPRINTAFLLELLLALLIKAIPVIHQPLDWFQTFFHELSHGLAALISGGRIVSIQLSLDASGLCTTLGGQPALILFAGYAGSALWGTLIYLSVNARYAKTIALSLALLVLGVGLLWARDWITPWILLTLITLFLLAYRYGNHTWTYRFISFVGLYVLIESLRAPIYLIDGQSVGDGSELAKLTHLPEFFWILIWAALSLGLLIMLYRHSNRASYSKPEGRS